MLTLQHQAGAWETAACLVGIQETLRRELGAPPLPPTNQRHFDAIIHALEQQLGAEQFAAYRQQGQNMTMAAALPLMPPPVTV